MAGIVGTLLALALLIFLVYKGWGIIPTAFIATFIVILTNGNILNLFDIFRYQFLGAPMPLEGGGYSAMSGLLGFVSTNFFLLISGALFGTVMGETGAAKSIASFISKKLGAKNAILITIIVTAILSAGGISAFVCMFAVFPLVVHLFKEADIPRRYLVGAFNTGASTFTLGALPWMPTIHNLTPTEYLGTTAGAAPLMGIFVGICIFIACFTYLSKSCKKAKARGEHFTINPATDNVHFNSRTDGSELPSFGLSILAPIMAVAFCFIVNATIVADGICTANDGVAVVLAAVSLYCLIVFRKFIPNWKKTLADGIFSGAGPLIVTGSIVGFGSVVVHTYTYSYFMDVALNMSASPYFSAVISVNILCGITGSAAGGLRIFMDSCAQHFLKLGVNPQLFHRVACLSCAGLDSLPHNGAIVTAYQVMGSNHKESYVTTFICTVVITICAAVLGAIIATVLTGL